METEGSPLRAEFSLSDRSICNLLLLSGSLCRLGRISNHLFVNLLWSPYSLLICHHADLSDWVDAATEELLCTFTFSLCHLLEVEHFQSRHLCNDIETIVGQVAKQIP